MEIGELRRRIGRELDAARRDKNERRAATDAAQVAYQRFLNDVAAPLIKQSVTVLKAEGHAFTSFTPPESVRLASDRATDDFIEIELDDQAHPPQVVGRTSQTRGRRGVVVSERPIGKGKPIHELTDDDVVEFLLPELRRLVLRS